MTYFAAIFARRSPGQPRADGLHTHWAMRGTVMLSYVLPEQPGRQLDRLIKVLRMVIDDLWVDSRHDVLTPMSGAVPLTQAWIAALLSAWLARACPPSSWFARRLR
jgi:hypothetical protein